MLAMQRDHRWRDDQAWMPRAVRWASRGATAAVVGGSVAALGATLVFAPALVVVWKGMVLAGAGAAVAGRQVGQAVFHRQLRRLASGDLPLAEVDARPEGDLVVVRGTIEAEAPLTGVLVEATGVYRRMIWEPAGRWVSEAATDFTLIDAAGARVRVLAAGARWLIDPLEPWTYPRARFEGPGAPPAVRALAQRSVAPHIHAAERVLAVGEEVQVVGYKTASPDVGGRVVDYRLPPQRATLRSGPSQPLVITRVVDLPR